MEALQKKLQSVEAELATTQTSLSEALAKVQEAQSSEESEEEKQAALSKVTKEMEDAAAELVEARTKCAGLEQEMADLRGRHAADRAELTSQHGMDKAQAVGEQTARVAALEAELESLKERVELDKSNAAAAAQDQTQSFDDAAEELARAKVEVDRLGKEIDLKEAQLRDLQKALDTQVATLQEQLQGCQTQIDSLTQELQEARASSGEWATEKQGLNDQLSQSHAAHEELKTVHAKTLEDHTGASELSTQEVSRLNEEKTTLKSQIEQLQSQIQSHAAAMEDSSKEHQEKLQVIEAAHRDELERLTQEHRSKLDSLQDDARDQASQSHAAELQSLRAQSQSMVEEVCCFPPCCKQNDTGGSG